jgi:dienelactone hydrolase
MFAVLSLASLLCAADPNPMVEDSITVTVVGTLHTGIVAIGGETTGTTITAKGVTWELDFGKHADLRQSAKRLDGKKVQVAGTLERRPGIEIGERWIVTVTDFRDAGAAAAVGTSREDVSWLPGVQTPPTDIPREGIGTLAPLLVDPNGRNISSRDAWEQHRQQIRDEWLKFLGPMPDPRPAVKLEVLKSELVGPLSRELVRYEGEPGMFVEGYLLRDSKTRDGRKRPGIVALHQTTNKSIDEIAGVSGPSDMAIGEKLAQNGFIVFCPRCFLWQDAADYNEAVARHRERHPDVLGMAKMLYDAMRGVDVLVSLPDVDVDRIGACGHSLGAKETLYLAAFDQRIKAAVASEGGLGFRSTNWDAPWYLGPAIQDESFPLNHHQLLALIAPRPFLILAGELGRGAADGDRSWPLLDAALPVWKLYGEPARLGLRNHHLGHALPPAEYAYLQEWLTTYLK